MVKSHMSAHKGISVVISKNGTKTKRLFNGAEEALWGKCSSSAFLKMLSKGGSPVRL